MNDEIAGLIAAARADERERCAKMLETNGDWGPRGLARSVLRREAAADIRALGDE